MSASNGMDGLRGVKKPTWTCPNCGVAKFNSQREMVQHALPCKQGKEEA